MSYVAYPKGLPIDSGPSLRLINGPKDPGRPGTINWQGSQVESVKQHDAFVPTLLALAASALPRRGSQYSAALKLSRVCGSSCSPMGAPLASASFGDVALWRSLWVQGDRPPLPAVVRCLGGLRFMIHTYS
jgi:hypothetical protein